MPHDSVDRWRDEDGPKEPQPELRPRHVEIARCIAAGLTDQQIGRALFLSEHTVKGHIRNALLLSGSRNRTHLVATAIRAGYLDRENVGCLSVDMLRRLA